MRKLILLCTSLCAMVLLISASPVRAQNVLWVSATGSDANACSQSAPCATFQGAINKGGVAQINCLNSGNYGPFTITASITIDCGTGNVGNGCQPAGTAITLNTAAAATVVLRHLSLNGLGTAATGIAQSFSSGTLIVEDCMIHGFNNLGLESTLRRPPVEASCRYRIPSSLRQFQAESGVRPRMVRSPR